MLWIIINCLFLAALTGAVVYLHIRIKELEDEDLVLQAIQRRSRGEGGQE